EPWGSHWAFCRPDQLHSLSRVARWAIAVDLRSGASVLAELDDDPYRLGNFRFWPDDRGLCSRALSCCVPDPPEPCMGHGRHRCLRLSLWLCRPPACRAACCRCRSPHKIHAAAATGRLVRRLDLGQIALGEAQNRLGAPKTPPASPE